MPIRGTYSLLVLYTKPRHFVKSPAERSGTGLPAGGGGKGMIPSIRYEWSQEGEILTVDVTLDYGEVQAGSTHRLTVRLEPDGGWKYLSCQVTPE